MSRMDSQKIRLNYIDYTRGGSGCKGRCSPGSIEIQIARRHPVANAQVLYQRVSSISTCSRLKMIRYRSPDPLFKILLRDQRAIALRLNVMNQSTMPTSKLITPEFPVGVESMIPTL
jgi:hypothetical protein